MNFELVCCGPPSDDTITPEELEQMKMMEKGEKMTLTEFECSVREGFFNDDDGTAYYGDRSGPSTITISCEEVAKGYADYSFTHIYWMAK